MSTNGSKIVRLKRYGSFTNAAFRGGEIVLCHTGITGCEFTGVNLTRVNNCKFVTCNFMRCKFYGREESNQYVDCSFFRTRGKTPSEGSLENCHVRE